MAVVGAIMKVDVYVPKLFFFVNRRMKERNARKKIRTSIFSRSSPYIGL